MQPAGQMNSGRRRGKIATVQELTLQENIGFFIKAVYQRKYLIVFVTLLSVVLVHNYFSKQPPVYQTTAKIFIGLESGGNPGITPFGGKPEYSGFGDIKTHQAMMTTRLVAEKTVEELQTHGVNPFPGSPDPAVSLIDAMAVEVVTGTQILALQVDHTNPKIAADIANTAVMVYSRLLVSKGKDEISQSVGVLRGELNNLKKRLEEDQTQVKRFEMANPGVRDIGVLEDQLKTMREELVRQRSERSDLDSQLKEIEKLKGQSVTQGNDWKDMVVTYPMVAKDNAIQGIVQKIEQKELDLARSKKMFQEKYPEVQSLNTEIGTLRKLLARRVDKVIGESKSKYMSTLARTMQLETGVKECEDKLSTIFNKRAEYKALTGEVEVSQQLYDVLRERMKQADIDVHLRQTPAMVVSRATIPNLPYKPKTTRNTLLALVITLGISMYLSYVYFMNRHTVQREEDVREYLKIPLLGQLPKISEDDTQVPILTFIEGWERDAIHVLCQNLKKEITQRKSLPKVLVVTSTAAQEGKTFVCVNIATHLARFGQKVLIIEADLRGPNLAKTFGLETKGKMLEDYLMDPALSISQIIKSTNFENVSFIGMERQTQDPLSVLDSPRFQEIFKQLVPLYDLILIDTPPLGLFPDAETIAHRFPDVVFVMKEDKMPCHRINRVLNTLQRSGVDVIGGLINFRSMQFSLFPGSIYSYYSYRYTSLNPVARELHRIRKRIRVRLRDIAKWFVEYHGVFPKRSVFGFYFPGVRKR